MSLPSESDAAVTVDNLSVEFTTTLERRRGSMTRAVSARLRRSKTATRVHAVNDLSFTVPKGGVFGVIGHNGAGKSVTLKTIAGILRPTRGRVETRGRVTPLLSLGLGFNRELSGRENILLGGLAGGLSREEIEEYYPSIIEFAELGESLDKPMRSYSKGMGGRLAFAVASHLDPEILLIDEALSAGDARFRKKARERIVSLCEDGDTTVIMVSHGLSLLEDLTSQSLWLDQGRRMGLGPTPEIVEMYLEHLGAERETATTEEIS